MTLAVAWIRHVETIEELVIATDSRLRAGYAWDCCPKILFPKRGDCAVAFAGVTDYAYPMMLQILSTVDDHEKSRTRALDLLELKGHIVRIFNQMSSLIGDLPAGDQGPHVPEAEFLLGGYSWRENRFVVWLLHYDPSIQKFTFRPASYWRGGDGKKLIMWAGDEIPAAKDRLVALLRSRGKLQASGFDLEPLEVLRDMCRSDEYRSIGGPPQLVKVYRHMNVRPYAVSWHTPAGVRLSFLGRPLLDYERTQRLVINLDNMSVGRTWGYIGGSDDLS